METLVDQFYSYFIILDFAKKHLELEEPREFIENFLNYLLLFLRGIPGRAIQMPVPMHRARWMAKVIYAIKIFFVANSN